MQFTYADYSKLIKAGQLLAPVIPFGQWKGADHRALILRHDIDLDVRAAVDLAGVERTLGVRSSYFFLTTSPFYNLASAVNRKHLETLAADGFEIGLHFDPTLYPHANSAEELLPHVQEEAAYLALLCGQPVTSVSLHHPSFKGQFPLFKGFHNAYDPAFFNTETYLADSCMDFRGKDPMEFIQRLNRQPVQFLTHPLHWHETSRNYGAIFEHHINRDITEKNEIFSLNKTFNKDLPSGLPAYVLKASSTG